MLCTDSYNFIPNKKNTHYTTWKTARAHPYFVKKKNLFWPGFISHCFTVNLNQPCVNPDHSRSSVSPTRTLYL